MQTDKQKFIFAFSNTEQIVGWWPEVLDGVRTLWPTFCYCVISQFVIHESFSDIHPICEGLMALIKMEV